jgi:hypothetical protein
MQKYSLSALGVVLAIAGTLLANWGFSEGCTNEILTITPTLIGGFITWLGLLRKGDMTLSGWKK